ncbi:MAG: polyprenyl synthetase family protein [Propionibacterium sp.]|nr:polyprenyl synthetase family protein [Propionibacterium sp.]
MINDADALNESLERRLAAVEERLLQAAVAQNPFTTEAARHLISAGGKRFRPMLVAVASEFGPTIDEQRLVTAALAVEFTHVASLYHDDVMDEAALRRGAPSANARWGNSVAILIGDFLFARASGAVAELGPGFVKLQAETFARLVEGQVEDTRGPQPGDDPMTHYLKVLADKTGSLIATSARFGAMVAEADPTIIDALAGYGEDIGVVFQLSDDVIDITSDVTGKTPGTDLREGVPTLPTLLLAQSDDPADSAVKGLLAADLSDDANLARALAALREHRVIDEARAEIQRRADQAVGHLAQLPDGAPKEALVRLAQELVSRAS